MTVRLCSTFDCDISNNQIEHLVCNYRMRFACYIYIFFQFTLIIFFNEYILKKELVGKMQVLETVYLNYPAWLFEQSSFDIKSVTNMIDESKVKI